MNLRNALLGLILCAAALPGRADIIVYGGSLLGTNEVPSNASPASGFAVVTIDTIAQTMRTEAFFADLIGTTTAAHIHCCTPPGTNIGVATQTPSFTGFPLGVSSGTFDNTFDLTAAASFNPAFVTANGGTAAGAQAVLLAGLAAGNAYFNVHSTFAPGGEIRANLVQLPEPGTMALTGLGIAAMLGFTRRSIRTAKLR